MKSRFTHPPSQVVLTSILIVISIACSSSKSAESPSAQRVNATSNQTLSSPGTSTTTQDKSLCSLGVSQAPVIKGLKLGMTKDEVVAMFPGSKDDPDVRNRLSSQPNQLGSSSLLIRPSKYENQGQFAEISQITFSFLDGRVSRMYVGFNGPKWAHVDQFVTKFVEGTTLPAVDSWAVHVGLDNQLKILTCAQFEVRIFSGGEGGNLNHVQIQDLEADKKLKDRRKKAREQASPTPGNQ